MNQIIIISLNHRDKMLPVRTKHAKISIFCCPNHYSAQPPIIRTRGIVLYVYFMYDLFYFRLIHRA